MENVLLEKFYPLSNQQLENSEALLRELSQVSFDFDRLTAAPDDIILASASTVVLMIQPLMQALELQNDTSNYLWHNIQNWLDPQNRSPDLQKRTIEVKSLLDERALAQVRRFISLLPYDMPSEIVRVDRIRYFWASPE